MTRLRFTQVDAFADAPFTGNPAAVMPLDAWLDDAVLQAIAAENNLSETAFTVPTPDDAEADYMMAVYDPLTALAKADRAALDALLSSVRPGEAAVQQMLSDIVNREQLYPPAESPEYNEPVESETEYIECPSCGHKWPR